MNIFNKHLILLCSLLICCALFVFFTLESATLGMLKNNIPGFDQKYVPGASVKEVYRLRLDPGDYLLEGIKELIERENIQDGAVVSGIGTLSECRMHWVTTTGFPSVQKKETLMGALELLSIQGIIADGVAHLHMTVSDTSRAVGGHLEEGCRVLYLAEIVIEEYDGIPLTRRPNKHGTNMLEMK